MESIKGKVVAITGSSSGIGRQIALTLAKQGARVVLGARRTGELTNVVEEIRNNGGTAAFSQADVKNKADLKVLIDMAVRQFGRLDVMVNNAGVAHLSRIDELDIEGWDEMIDINIKGTLYGMAAAMPVFKKQQFGHIINNISTSGIQIAPTQGVYAGTKNAIRTISEAFRKESDGTIRITGISPGYINTEFASNSVKTEELKAAAKEKVAEIAISPQAIANAVVYAIIQPKDVEVGDMVIRPAVQN
jgi:NADP-dependent 3-hydroxy acid dehydrogenase YdfG